MAKIYVSRVIESPVETVWEFSKSFDAMAKWNGDIVELHIEGGKSAKEIGCVRNFTLKNGANVRETLLAFSEVERSVTYDIIASPMPIRNYVATFTCRRITEGNQTLVEWAAQFEVSKENERDMMQHIERNVFAAGLEAIGNALHQLA